MKNELAAKRGGLDVLLQTLEANIALLQVGDRVDQMAQGPTQSVKLPDNQGVARPQLVENLAQLGALVDRTAGSVGEDPIATGSLERVELEVRVLVGC
jgi:hypothetical protein